tara:strand:- start:1052 stop:1468 length:417 start_codon:yes stop_codon:yes gene_type:complete
MKLSDFNINPDLKMLREFGVFALFGFGLIGFVMGFKWDIWQIGYGLLALGVISFILSFIDPKLLKPIFISLTIVAFPIGFIISNIILAVIFYGIISPVAIIFKVFRRDALNRKIEPESTSYWILREEKSPVSQRFKQY